MGTVSNPCMKHKESDERAAETVVFGRGKSDSTAEVAHSGTIPVSCMGEASLVKDHSRANSTAWQHPPICNHQLYITEFL